MYSSNKINFKSILWSNLAQKPLKMPYFTHIYSQNLSFANRLYTHQTQYFAILTQILQQILLFFLSKFTPISSVTQAALFLDIPFKMQLFLKFQSRKVKIYSKFNKLSSIITTFTVKLQPDFHYFLPLSAAKCRQNSHFETVKSNRPAGNILEYSFNSV